MKDDKNDDGYPWPPKWLDVTSEDGACEAIKIRPEEISALIYKKGLVGGSIVLKSGARIETTADSLIAIDNFIAEIDGYGGEVIVESNENGK